MRASLGDTIKKGIGCGSGVRAVLENRKIVTCFIAFGLMFLLVVSTGTGSMTQTSLSRDSQEESCSDLAIAGFKSPTREDKNASVSIKNVGAENATNVTVRFKVSEHEEIEVTGKDGYKQMTKEGAANIRVHFKTLNAKNGWLEIKRNCTDEEPVKRYSGDIFNEWSPWVKGDSLWIVCELEQEYIIDAWEWGEIVDVRNVTLNANESVYVHIPPPWCEETNYEQPRNLKVTVDPDNNITESDEDNNNRTGVMYIDLEANNLTFVSPDKEHLCVLVEKNIIRATIKNNNETDGIVFPAGGDKRNFNVALEVRDLNGTVVYRHTGNSNAENSSVLFEFPHADKTLYAGEEINVTFNIGAKIYPDFVGDTKNYKVSVIADSENDINEANEFYPRGEGNNVTSETVTVYHMSGYTGGDLDTVSPGKIYGDMIYSIGGSGYDDDDVPFSDISSQIPDNATIRVARLYFHWFYWPEHVFADVDMQFNGEPVSRVRTYYDDTIATHFPTRWGTYVYDVTDEVRDIVAHGGNYEASIQIYDAAAHCTGMGLLIVYEDESKPLIEYGIAEGTWTLMADNKKHPSGLLPEQCTANASFPGVVNTSKGKAELLTVLASWKKEDVWSGTIGDALLFNGRDVGTPIGTSYWAYKGDKCMALTLNNWEDVTEYLSPTQNKAEIQSRGNFMFVTNALFKVTYLPDLTATLNAPSSVKGGATRMIEATIHNRGESKAENFGVRFTATDGTPREEFRTIKLLEGNDNTTIDFTWTAPDKLEGLEQNQTQNVTISVMADSGKTVEEFDESNNIGSKDISVTITEKPLTLSFDTGSPEKPYPSISGIHEGFILLNNTVTVNTLYTYPCAGTGGHTESVVISNKPGVIATANWTGYTEDYHNITFTQKFTLHAREKYNYTLITGSYPQIIHEQNHTTFNGYISCSSFIDTNGREYNDWIPAIRLFLC